MSASYCNFYEVFQQLVSHFMISLCPEESLFHILLWRLMFYFDDFCYDFFKIMTPITCTNVVHKKKVVTYLVAR